LLQMRLAELKEDKEKEVAEVRTQYNNIKQEIRSYERILPTHTFLQESGISIDELPTY
jgi:FtsZ-binding cell division protein ZapB